jgi:hypothetical protein
VHAHYVTRRYAEFAASMTALGDGLGASGGDGQLEHNLERMRAAVAAGAYTRTLSAQPELFLTQNTP